MLDFPNAPTNGQLYNASNGVTYQWMSTPAIWVAQGSWRPPNPETGNTDVWVDLFGAVGDGVTDDTAAIQSAIDFAGNAPCADVRLPGKLYKITATLNVPYANVSIIGAGADVAHTQFAQGDQPSTKLIWAGATGGTMMHIHSPVGAATQAMSGGGVRGIYFHCAASNAGSANTGADIAIQISSRRSGWYEDLYFEQPRVVALLLDTVLQLGDDRGCHNNVFFTCVSRNQVSNQDGGFVKLLGDTSVPPGESNSNCYFNLFMNCRPVFNSGICYDLGNSDHNRFIGCAASCSIHSYATSAIDTTITLANPAVVTTASPHGLSTGYCTQFTNNGDTLPAPLQFNTKYYVTRIDANNFNLSTTLANRVAGVLINTSASAQSGTHKSLPYSGYGIYFRASTPAGFEARTNTFIAFSGGDVIYCEGTENGLTGPSHNNNFDHLDYSNFTPQPTLGISATSNVMSRDDGTQPRAKFVTAAFAGASLLSSTNSGLLGKVQARMVSESLRIANGAVDHIRFELPDGTYDNALVEWNVGITGAGDLRWNPTIGGTGLVTVIGGLRSFSQTHGIGYGVGSGGTPTIQSPNKTSTVSMDRMSILIRTASDSLAANTSVGFQWTSSGIAVGDVLVINHDPTIGGTEGAYVFNARCFAGAAQITIRNVTAGALSELIGIRIVVIKGVTS